MNSDPMDELDALIIDWEEGALDEREVARLRDWLKTDAEARERFVQLRIQLAAMALDSSAGLDSIPDRQQPRVRNPETFASHRSASRSFRFRKVIAAIAVSLALIVIGSSAWWLADRKTTATNPSPGLDQTGSATGQSSVEPTAKGVALLTKLVDVDFDLRSPTKRWTVGEALSPGLFAIDSGFAQIEFFCGATVVLEGPAELRIESSTLAHFRYGQLRAQVPPAARGFQIHVDNMRVVDLGTEFGISATLDSRTDTGNASVVDVQVFDGQVELHQPGQPMRVLDAGQSVTRSAIGTVNPSAIKPWRFTDIEELDQHAKSQSDSRWQTWNEYSSRLRSDPRVIAYYAMDGDQTWQRKLPNNTVPPNNELDGAIVGARRVQGRFPEKSALEFKRPGDRVRVNVPGQFGSLTLACWVKIDSLDRWYNSLFLTDNYQRGEPHWQILNTGQLFFSVRVSDQTNQQEHREVLSPPFWEPAMSGQWMHLATVYDVDEKQTTHFLNGRVLSRESIPEKQLVRSTRIGPASIGNWSVPTKPDADFAIRNLNGSIDEFALFSDALADDEIRTMFENGKP